MVLLVSFSLAGWDLSLEGMVSTILEQCDYVDRAEQQKQCNFIEKQVEPLSSLMN